MVFHRSLDGSSWSEHKTFEQSRLSLEPAAGNTMCAAGVPNPVVWFDVSVTWKQRMGWRRSSVVPALFFSPLHHGVEQLNNL